MFIYKINPAALRKVLVYKYSSGIKNWIINTFPYFSTKIINKIGEHLKINEYPVEQSGKLSILWEKLPNSGKTLKLLIPNLVEFYRGGWTNYPCKVTSQKITLCLLVFTIEYPWNVLCPWLLCLARKSSQKLLAIQSVQHKYIHIFILNTTQAREMGNRGSKSNYIKFVKEQRANGSYINKKIQDLVLRCALRGFERKFIAGNPSNIILNKQLYTTTTAVSAPRQKIFLN